MAVIMFILYLIEAKRQGFSPESFYSLRQMILIFHILSCFGVFFHYIIVDFKWERVSFLVLEMIKNICFFSLFYYYCKKSTGFLPSKRNWMKLFGALLLAGFLMEIISTYIMFVEQGLSISQGEALCTKPIFIIMNGVAYVMIYVFLSITVVISRNVKKAVFALNKESQKNRRVFERSE
jgi:hypothetical protein